MRFQSILLLVLLLYSQSSNVLAPPPLSLYRRRLLEKQMNNSLKMNLGPIMSQPLLARAEEPNGFWATMLKIAEFMPAVRIFRLPFG